MFIFLLKSPPWCSFQKRNLGCLARTGLTAPILQVWSWNLYMAQPHYLRACTRKMGAFQQRFQGAPSQGFEANSQFVIPNAHFPIVFSSLMFIVKKFGLLGKNWVGCPTFAGMVLKSLLGTATLSESMHKDDGSIQAKISGGSQSRVWSQFTLSKPWCSFSY